MNNKTVRPPIITGNCSGSKRKEINNGSERPKYPPPTTPMTKLIKPDKPRAGLLKPDKPRAGPEPSKKGSKPMMSSNKGSNPKLNKQLLAGYLAHEFLTKGTIMGRRWGHAPSQRVESQQRKYERYVELAKLLKKDGTKLEGIVNPTQLAQFLRLV